LRRRQPAAPQASRNPLAERSGLRQRLAVERQHMLDAAHRPGQEDLLTSETRQGQCLLADIDSGAVRGLDRPSTGDAGEDATVGRGRGKPPVTDDKEAGARSLEGSAVAIDQQ